MEHRHKWIHTRHPKQIIMISPKRKNHSCSSSQETYQSTNLLHVISESVPNENVSVFNLGQSTCTPDPRSVNNSMLSSLYHDEMSVDSSRSSYCDNNYYNPQISESIRPITSNPSSTYQNAPARPFEPSIHNGDFQDVPLLATFLDDDSDREDEDKIPADVESGMDAKNSPSPNGSTIHQYIK